MLGGSMTLWVIDDGTPAAKGVRNILESQPPRNNLSDECFFIMTGGLPYTAKQHKMMTEIANDSFFIVIVVELRQRDIPGYHLRLHRDYVYYLDGLISVFNINQQINRILASLEERRSKTISRSLIADKVSDAERASLVGILYNQSCKSYAEARGISIKAVSEYRRSVIKKLGTHSPASLHAQLCVDGIIESNVVKATLDERNDTSLIYYAKLLQDIITPEGVKALRHLSIP